MSEQVATQNVVELFLSEFGLEPEVVSFAPGRVNLLGEHTDYNGGVVLPVPLPMGTAIAMSWGAPQGRLVVRSGHETEVAERSLSDRPDNSWSDYVLGAVVQGLNGDKPKEGLRIAVSTTLPVGSGLSSSAALIVAILRGIAKLTGQTKSPVETAKDARRVENDFVGLPCGIMDQFAVSVGRPGHALYLDTTTLTYDTVALLPSHRFVVVHSGSGHKLTDNGYSTRVAECTAACKSLGVETLSQLTVNDLGRIDALEAPLSSRARHIVTENQRVKSAAQALAEQDAETFAEKMNESHASQRDDYEVSIDEIDSLVEEARSLGALGARLTGGGFGGSIVALVAAEMVDDWCAQIQERCPKARVLATV